jgi:hypothetical protein
MLLSFLVLFFCSQSRQLRSADQTDQTITIGKFSLVSTLVSFRARALCTFSCLLCRTRTAGPEVTLRSRPVHQRHTCLHLLCGARDVQKLKTRLVYLRVGTAQPHAAPTDTAVRCHHRQVLLLTNALDLRNDAPLPVQLRARKRQHEGSRWCAALCYAAGGSAALRRPALLREASEVKSAARKFANTEGLECAEDIYKKRTYST